MVDEEALTNLLPDDDCGRSEFIERLIKNMKITAACRFNASERVKSRSRSVNLMLALFASGVIVTSVLPMVWDFRKTTELLIFFSGLSASTFIVVLSLYQWSSSDDVNAEKFHQAGIKIAALRRNLELSKTSASIDCEEYVEKYSDILRECGINHDDIDHTRYRLTKTDSYDGNLLSRFRDWFLVSTSRVPALAFVSFAVLLGLVTVSALAFSDITKNVTLESNNAKIH